ncbi:MAG TPA: hypothetical protein VGM56_04495 [Byssovorax sp.]|nr:hypothetical protein [Polyangia bacterium]
MTEAASEGETKVPTLVVAPGSSFADIVTASDVVLTAPESLDGAWRVQPQGKHRVRLDHPKIGFTLPPTVYSLVEAKKTVTRIRSTPQLGYLDLEGALALVQSLHGLFVDAGWESRRRYPNARVEWMFGSRSEVLVGTWRPLPDIRKIADPTAGYRVDVEVRRAVDAGTAEAKGLGLDGAGFLVTALVSDELRDA